MAKTIKVVIGDINVQEKVKQSMPGAILSPNFAGLTIEQINELFKADEKAEIVGAFRPIGKEDRSYDAFCKLKDFMGTISLSEELTLTLRGEGNFKASAYAWGIVEDEGAAEVWISGIYLPNHMLGVSFTAEGGSIKIATVKKK